MAAQATRATVLLTKLGIEFRVHAYDHDPRAAAYGTEAVERLGLAPDRTFKTLLATSGDRLVVGVVPVSTMLDLKAFAATAGVKSLTMAEAAVAERATGYVVGGISPIGQQRRLATFIDDSATSFDTVFCSAGRRGLEIELTPADLRRAADATFAAIARR